jgi:hypothetical protein
MKESKCWQIVKFAYYFFACFGMLFCSKSYSQPSFAQVQSDVKKEYNEGVTVVDRGLGSKTEIDKSVIPNRTYWLTFVRASNTRSIEGYNIKVHRNIDVRYLLSGGKYVFSSALKFGYWLIGVPKPPSLSEVTTLINNNMEKFFGNFIFTKMTEYGGVKQILTEKYDFLDCDNFFWDGDYEGKRVQFKVKVAYTMINNRSLEKHEDVFELTLMRESINKPWSDLRVDGGSRVGKSRPLESKDLTDKELQEWECNTLGMKYLKTFAVEEYNKLPKVDIPAFKSAEEMIWWFHRFLRKASPQEVEYVLLNKLNSGYFSKCGNYILSQNGYDLLENIKNFVSTKNGNYADHYCEYPKIKHQQSNMIQYYAKTEDLFSRISVDPENGVLKFTAIELGRYKEDVDIARLKQVPDDKCKEYAPAEWAIYKLDEVATSASFPSTAQKQTYSNDPTAFSLTATKNGVEYTIFANIVSQDIIKQIKQESQRPSTAKLWSENFRTALGAMGNKDEWWEYKGTQAYKCAWKINQNGAYVPMRYKAILYKDIFLKIWVIGEVADAEADKFFNSLNIGR